MATQLVTHAKNVASFCCNYSTNYWNAIHVPPVKCWVFWQFYTLEIWFAIFKQAENPFRSLPLLTDFFSNNTLAWLDEKMGSSPNFLLRLSNGFSFQICTIISLTKSLFYIHLLMYVFEGYARRFHCYWCIFFRLGNDLSSFPPNLWSTFKGVRKLL